MKPQLQHGIHATAGFGFELLQRVEIPGIDDEGLLAERMSADAQRRADVRVVKVVRRTDADVVDAIRRGAPPQLLEMAIEAFEFVEESDVERVAIENADGVVRIDGGDEPIAGRVDRFELSLGDKAGDSGEREIFFTGHACSALTITAGASDRQRSE